MMHLLLVGIDPYSGADTPGGLFETLDEAVDHLKKNTSEQYPLYTFAVIYEVPGLGGYPLRPTDEHPVYRVYHLTKGFWKKQPDTTP